MGEPDYRRGKGASAKSRGVAETLESRLLLSTTMLNVTAPTGLLFDRLRDRLYVSSLNGTIQPIDVATHTLLTPLRLSPGSSGIESEDLSPDGSSIYATLLTNASAPGTIDKVNLADNSIQQITFPLLQGESRASGIAVAENGTALISCSGFGGVSPVSPLRQLDLATGTVTTRTDAPGASGGLLVPGSVLVASPDRKVILAADPGATLSAFTYDTASDTFGPAYATSGFFNGAVGAAISPDDSLLAITSPTGTEVVDRAFQPVHDIGGIYAAVAFDPTGRTLYVAQSTGLIAAYDTATWRQKYTIPIQVAFLPGISSQMLISPDGSKVFVLGANAVAIVDLPQPTGSASVLTAAVSRFVRTDTPTSLTLTATDPVGNVVSGYRGTVHFMSSDAGAALPADYTFTAADAGTHTFTFSLHTLGNQTVSVTDSTTASIGATSLAITVHAPGITSIPANGLRLADVIDDAPLNELVMTTTAGTVERYDLASESLLPSIGLDGTTPAAADVTQDGRWLYVIDAQPGFAAAFVRRVDLLSGAVTSFPYQTNFNEAGGYGIAVAANGKAFLTNNVLSSTTALFPLRELDPEAGSISARGDGPGSIGPASALARSADGKWAVLLDNPVAGEPLYLYSSDTDSFSGPVNTNPSVSSRDAAAVSADGSMIALREGSAVEVFDHNLNLLKTLSGFQNALAFDPVRAELYGFDAAGHLVAYNTKTWNLDFSQTLPSGLNTTPTPGTDPLAVSPDGNWIYVAGVFAVSVIKNGGPPVASAGGPYTVNELSHSVTLNGSATVWGPGNSVAKYEWDLNYDGSTFNPVATGANPTVPLSGLTGPATRVVALRVTDATGLSTLVTTTMTTNDVPPILAATGAGSVAEGGTYTLNLSSTVFGSDPLQSWTVDWGDGSPPQSYGNVASVTHVYTDGPATQTIRAWGTDKDGTWPAHVYTAGLDSAVALDPSFAQGGLARVIPGSTGGSSLAVQDDGRIVVMAGGGLVRLNSDGSPDTSFRRIDSVGLTANSLSLQEDGKILVCGQVGTNAAITRFNAGGSLDTGFGTNGVVNISPGTSSHLYRVIALPDGKILLAGDALLTGGYQDFLLARLNPDGSLDSAFGTNGITLTGTQYGAAAFVMALQADGKILLAGTSFNVVRYTPDGQVDSTFLSTTRFPSFFPNYAGSANAMLVQPDGRIILGGNISGYPTQTPTKWGLVRLSPDGSVDQSFGNLGTEIISLNGGTVSGTALEPDGAIAGLLNTGSPTVSSLVTLTPAGLSGAAPVPVPLPPVSNPSNFGTDLAIQPDGRLLILTADGQGSAWMYRFTSGGGARVLSVQDIAPTATLSNSGPVSLGNPVQIGFSNATDPSPLDRSAGFTYAFDFGNDGSFADPGDVDHTPDSARSFTFTTPGPRVVRARIYDKDGNFTEYATTVTVQAAPATAASATSGLWAGDLDPTFGSAGFALTASMMPLVYASAVQTDGKVILAGGSSYSAPQFALVRLNSDGTPDSTFGSSGVVVTPTQKSGQAFYSVALQPDGKIVAGGGTDYTLVRYNPDGSLDTSFGSGGIASVASFNGIGATNGLGEIWSISVLPDGRILAAESEAYGESLMRFNSDGSLDTTFGLNGSATVEAAGTSYYGLPVRTVVRADGSILIADKWSYQSPSYPYNVVAGVHLQRFSADGAPDPGFIVTLPSVNDLGGLGIAPDGSIYLASDALNQSNLSRFTPSGVLDTSYGAGGHVGLGQGTIGQQLLVQPDGKVVVDVVNAAYANQGTTTVVRLGSDGVPDPSFQASGPPNPAPPSIPFFGTVGVFAADAGKVIVVAPVGVKRYLGTPTASISFAADGTLLLQGCDAPDAFSVSSDGQGNLLVGADGEFQSFAAGSVQSIQVLGGGSDDVLTLVNSPAVPVSFDGEAGSNSVVFNGSPGNDTIVEQNGSVSSGGPPVTFANVAALRINAGAGDDTLIIRASTPGVTATLDGGAGNDSIDASAATTPSSIVGGAGDDTILARNGQADTIDGGAGNNTATVDAQDSLTNVQNVVGLAPSVTGAVFDNADGSGARATGDLGLGGWLVWTDDNQNGIVDAGEQVAYSNSLGAYTLTNLTAGLHYVTIRQQPGWQEAGPTRQGVLVSNSTNSYAEVDFAETRGGMIRGEVFADANHNGAIDPGEAGAAGWTVYLDLNGSGRLDAGEPSDVTDAMGWYRFGGLPNGTYVVREVSQAGYGQTTPAGYAYTLSTLDRDSGGWHVFGNVAIASVPMDFPYLLTLAQHYAQQGTFATGDLNGDGTVNFADLLLLAQNYGHALPASGGAAASSDSANWLLRKRKG